MTIAITVTSLACAREEEILNELCAEAARTVRPNLLIITPATRWAQSLEERVAKRAGDSGAIGLPAIHGWHRCIGNLAAAANNDLDLIGSDQRLLMALTLMRDAADDLPEPWKTALHSDGYADSLLRLFDDLLSGMMSSGNFSFDKPPSSFSEIMKAIIAGAPPIALKPIKHGGPIWILFKQFTQRLLERNWIDEAWREKCAVAMLNKPLWRLAYPEISRIAFFGFDEFAAPMRRMIELLNAQGLVIEIVLETADESSRWKNHGDEIISWARAIGATVTSDAGMNANFAGRPFAPLACQLFMNAKTPSEASAWIQIAAYPNRHQEIEGIARMIKQRIVASQSKEDDDRNRIAIACASLSDYATPLKDALERLGLRCSVGGGETLVSHPVAQAALGLLSWPSNDFKVDQLRAAISYSFVSVRMDDGELLTPAGVDRVSRLCRVKQGESAWRTQIRQTLDARMAQMKAAVKDGWYPEDEYISSDQYVANLVSDIDLLRLQGAAIIALIDRLAPLDEDLSGNEFEKLCQGVIGDFITIAPPDDFIHARYRQAGREFSVLNALKKSASLIADTLETGRSPIPGRDLMQWLRRIISDAAIHPGGDLNRREAPIIIASMEGARGLDADILILCGMAEGAYPGFDRRNPLLPGDSDTLARQSGESLSRRHRHCGHFRRLLTQARREIIATHPMEVDGEVCIRSSFLIEAERLGFSENLIADAVDLHSAISSPHDLWMFFGGMSATEWSGLVDEWKALSAAGRNRWEAAAGGIHRAMFGESIEARRYLRNTGPGVWEGVMDNDAALLNYLQSYYAHHIFSPTELESLALCGIRHLLQRHAGFDEPEALEDEITPLESGLALHQTLQRFFEEKMRLPDFNPEIGVTLNPALFESDLTRLRAIANSLLAQLPYSGVAWEAWKREFLGDDTITNDDSVVGTLRAFLEFETEKMKKCHPRFLEVPFGRMRASSGRGASPPVLQDGCGLTLDDGTRVEFRGRMDRVDFVEDDGAAVWDYKSGRERAIKEIQNGFLFQAILYAEALRAALPEMGASAAKRQVACSGYYVIKGEKASVPTGCIGQRPVKGVRNNNAIMMEDGAAIARLHLGRLLNSLNRGVFAHTRDENFKPCSYCAFNQICRKVYWKHEEYSRAQGYPPGEVFV